ncbi:33 kDa chaperonin [BD1-7 clade bacterium]|uniref:33 kDa chaperonin n=1 Tax=BD1-7 clade bacterium TaxID=2029982 RepID=A0A5S9N246_9GAMM|nr:33 kDa chaperonin [BD1-7 clade bacterium]CAA0083774.1 33 kDa chaperonin [BD1-7 clade bacterium]
MAKDTLQTFSFDNTDIRGAIVTLDTSFAKLVDGSHYNAEQHQLLGQFCAANLLLTSHLKLDGLLSIQARGNGPVDLIVSEATHDLTFRGLLAGEVDEQHDLLALLGDATLVISVEPENGQRYQGIVPLDHSDLAGCLQSYFQQSEQLPSWFAFNVTEEHVRGVMLQALPADRCADLQQRAEDWQRITHLASTLSDQEMQDLDNETLLYRLYHEEQLRLYDAKPVDFRCSCSRERMERGLLSLGETELNDILNEQEAIETDCHFCYQRYAFTAADVRALISGNHYQKTH